MAVAIINTSGTAIAKGMIVDSDRPIVPLVARRAVAAIIETLAESERRASAVINEVRRKSR
jgi:hypothetical protein